MTNPNSKKKVLFLITKSNWGGAQRYVYDLATSLPTDTYETSVALGGNGDLVEKLRDAHVPVHPLHSLQRDVSFWQELKALREIFTTIWSIQPDVLHINSSKAGIFGVLLGQLLMVPRVIFTAHGWAFNEDRPAWQRYIIKYLHWLTVLFSHHTIAVSQAVKTQLDWPFVSRKMTVIHNGRQPIDFLTPRQARASLGEREPGLQNHDTAVWTGTIGELHPIKQHGVMIEAVANLISAGHEVYHVIFGDGERKNALQQLINAKGLAHHVFLLGHVKDATMYLSALTIYTQPSRSEALAYTVIEAAQAGLPIIASRVGGIPEIITDKQNGTLIEAGNVDALTSALTAYLAYPEQRQRHAAAAKKTSQRFTISQMVTETCAVYSASKVSSAR